ncbi:carbamate kinase [Clostridium sp. NSJ-49]|nr:carbamate kinase [Clostridium sp. NSJ-49]MCD2502661.1 carbamate kinase [Clostridium sp. NSJ-145]
MMSKVVIALGGNALGNNLEEQMVAVRSTAKAIIDLIEDGNEVIVSHGNGPQVGMINLAMTELGKNYPKYSLCPMSVCVAMSQGYIGYDLQNALREELLERGINKSVSTIITQVEVDKNDAAFTNPTKPIGGFMTKEEADLMVQKGENVIEDAGRGYRRVVASPKPKSIVEIETIKTLADAGHVVVACGGGGIPVIKKDGKLKGVDAVIDKDFASCELAKELDADCLIILTAVEKAAINYGKENQKWLDDVKVEEMKMYVEEGQFAPGSMKPKVEAAIEFAESKEGRYALITLLERAKDGIAGKTGTRISK